MIMPTISSTICCIFVLYTTPANTTTIIPTSNEFLFKRFGQLIPELSWGTIRVHINMSYIFTATNYICNASRLLDSEWGKIKTKHGKGFNGVPPTKVKGRSSHLSVPLIKDISKMCEENSNIIQELIEVYHLSKLDKPEELKYSAKHIKKTSKSISLVRNARKVILGTAMAAIGIVASLISIFTSTERINMSSSSDSEGNLIDDNNHIITSLQSHENSIKQDEESIQEINDHLCKLEKTLFFEQQTDDFYLNLFNLRLHGSSASNHLQRMQDSLFSLLENKLSSKLVPLRTIEPVVEKLRKGTGKRGYNLAINSISDMYMCDISFVAYVD